MEEASRNEDGIRNKHKLSENMTRLIEKRDQLRKNIHESEPHNLEYVEINKLTKREIRRNIRQYNLNLTKRYMKIQD